MKGCRKLFDGVAYGALVRQKRGREKLTQETLASDVFGDLTRKGDISRIENGKITPQEATIRKINTALGISEAEMEPIRQSRPISGQLDNIPTLSREQLENLAARFGIEGAYDKGDEELRGFLTDKANDYRALRQQIAQLDDHVAEIAELKIKAEAAAEAGNLEEVDNLLAVADVTETAINAQTKITRASNALLRNRPEQAFEILSAVADSFRSADPTAPARIRGQLFKQLYDHGLRYGGQGLPLAEKMLEEAAAALPANAPEEVSIVVHGNLAETRRALAPRLAGPVATEKMGQAAETLRNLSERLSPDDLNGPRPRSTSVLRSENKAAVPPGRRAPPCSLMPSPPVAPPSLFSPKPIIRWNGPRPGTTSAPRSQTKALAPQVKRALRSAPMLSPPFAPPLPFTQKPTIPWTGPGPRTTSARAHKPRHSHHR